MALSLCALLHTLPGITQVLPPPGTTTGRGASAARTDLKRLSTVRSLLAKAESTQYEEEAQALSAKAQQLISRYALDRMIDADQAGPDQQSGSVATRRVWIDRPYVFAKATLIGVVSDANRCRSVLSEQLDCCTVVGEPADLEAVELMATSLLVQANTAMLGCGRHGDRRGTSRTTSFRRSFLLAYASRIGERLQSATDDAVEQTGRGSELVPLLERHDERVHEAFGQIFPERGRPRRHGHQWVRLDRGPYRRRPRPARHQTAAHPGSRLTVWPPLAAVTRLA